MRIVLFFIISFLLVSCKKEADKPVKKIEKITRVKPYEGKIIAIDSAYLATFSNDDLKDFYQSFNNETVWQSTPLRTTVLNEIKNAEMEGLFSEDYQYKKLAGFEKNIQKLSDKQLVEYDLLLTLNALKYIQHISKGKLDPKTIYVDWELFSKSVEAIPVLQKAFTKNHDFKSVLDSCKPQHPVYKKLKLALELINTFPKDKSKPIVFEGKITLNDTASVMKAIKRKLVYWKDMKVPDTLTNVYDKSTMEAVKNFQFRHGLATDGVIGKGTLSALNYSKAERKQQITANMERWKWYSYYLGEEYLLANIPDYSLVVIKNNDTISNHKIIVGTNKRKTPILSSKLSYVVFNPTWTVPPTILKEDVIPAATKNRGYFASKNITIYDNQGLIVPASEWNPSRGRTYRYVQSPGAYNSLGMVKIIFPNRFSVYLHDTNHRDYFDKSNRSLSSGCVRVQNPIELSNYLIKDSINYSMDSITSILTKLKPKTAPIKSKIYIHLWYWTAWHENEKLIFRDDIYNLDKDLYKEMIK